MRSRKGLRIGSEGMALPAVMAMLVVMTIIGAGMYQLVQSTIGVSGSYFRKASVSGVASSQASLIMETIADSIPEGAVRAAPGLIINDPDNVFQQMTGGATASDYAYLPCDPGDGADCLPDFEYRYGSVVAYGDVDFVQAIPLDGGSIEFASAYDGVGQGQTLGSSFVVENHVRIVAIDERSGARTEVRYIATR